MFTTELTDISKETSILSTKQLRNLSESKHPNQKISYHKGSQRLKRGLYAIKDIERSSEVANKMVEPSYISLETALSIYGLIPDAVTSYTSVTTKKTQMYKNSYGVFYYKKLKEEYYFGFLYKDGMFIAEKEKAILDYFYLKSSNLKMSVDDYKNIASGKISSQWALRALRWMDSERFEGLETLDYRKLHEYAGKMNKKVMYMARVLERYHLDKKDQFHKYKPLIEVEKFQIQNPNIQRWERLQETRSNFLLFDIESNEMRQWDETMYETIQIGYIKADSDWNILKQWSIFVKPAGNYILSDFIRNETDITYAHLKNGVSFLEGLEEFLKMYNPLRDYLVSYGNNDMKQLYSDCKRNGIPYPFWDQNSWKYERHINVKNLMAKKRRTKEVWMARLMGNLYIPLKGQHHNGEDDCVNILECMKKVLY